MNILITSNDPYPQYMGGDKRVAISLAKEWTQCGHNAFFCATLLLYCVNRK